MKTILFVFGTRPEAIKMAPLILAFKEYCKNFRTFVCTTGQHRQMLDQVLNLFEIKPDFDLNIMKSGQDLYDITSRVLLGLKDVLDKVKPDYIFVHGDTTTSMAGAIAAFYKQIPVAHVEAGLRTGNIYSPWPEEINRQIISRIASLHFAPTKSNFQNLINEGVEKSKISITGNTVIDALQWVLKKIDSSQKIQQEIKQALDAEGLPIEKITGKKIILITGHRRENFGESFKNICSAIKELGSIFPDIVLVYPMHPNPNIRNAIKTFFSNVNHPNIYFINPLNYLTFVYLMSISYIVLTDSGGIQEEAPGIGKPVLVMRDTTERQEAIDAGTVKLVGTNTKRIIEEVSALLTDEIHYKKMSQAINPYGNGNSCKNIITAFEKTIRKNEL